MCSKERRAAFDRCNEVHLTRRPDGLEQPHRRTLAVDCYGNVGPEPVLIEQALPHSGAVALEVLDHLAHCRAFYVYRRSAARQGLQQSWNINSRQYRSEE